MSKCSICSRYKQLNSIPAIFEFLFLSLMLCFVGGGGNKPVDNAAGFGRDTDVIGFSLCCGGAWSKDKKFACAGACGWSNDEKVCCCGFGSWAVPLIWANGSNMSSSSWLGALETCCPPPKISSRSPPVLLLLDTVWVSAGPWNANGLEPVPDGTGLGSAEKGGGLWMSKDEALSANGSNGCCAGGWTILCCTLF